MGVDLVWAWIEGELSECWQLEGEDGEAVEEEGRSHHRIVVAW